MSNSSCVLRPLALRRGHRLLGEERPGTKGTRLSRYCTALSGVAAGRFLKSIPRSSPLQILFKVAFGAHTPTLTPARCRIPVLAGCCIPFPLGFLRHVPREGANLVLAGANKTIGDVVSSLLFLCLSTSLNVVVAVPWCPMPILEGKWEVGKRRARCCACQTGHWHCLGIGKGCRILHRGKKGGNNNDDDFDSGEMNMARINGEMLVVVSLAGEFCRDVVLVLGGGRRWEEGMMVNTQPLAPCSDPFCSSAPSSILGYDVLLCMLSSSSLWPPTSIKDSFALL